MEFGFDRSIAWPTKMTPDGEKKSALLSPHGGGLHDFGLEPQVRGWNATIGLRKISCLHGTNVI